MKAFLWIVVLAGIGLVASARLKVFGQEPELEVSSSSLFSVVRGDLPITISENGYLKAENSLNIKPKFKREGLITWMIEEGEEVEEGAKLVEFDKSELESKITEIENSLIQYEIELEAARANLQIQTRDNQATIEKAELAEEIAELTLERYREGEVPNELRKKGLAIEKAESEFRRATERCAELPELVEQGYLTALQEEEELIRMREAEINLENAQKDLELYEVYTTKMELRQKEAAVTDGIRQLENARKKADINLKEKQALVAQKERQVTSTETRLEQLREELDNHTIVAEAPGIVHWGDPARPWMRDQIKVGNRVHHGTTVITLPDLSDMQVLVQVHEADIDLIVEDMVVIVTVDTAKGTAFPARITDIAAVASSSSWTDETNKTFRVEVSLDPTEQRLRAGVTARAEIQVEELEDVLYAPIHALAPEGGEHLAFVFHEGEYEERKVEVGKNNAHYVEIIDGLSEGEQVLLYDPREAGLEGAERSDDDSENEDTELSTGLAGMGAEI